MPKQKSARNLFTKDILTELIPDIIEVLRNKHGVDVNEESARRMAERLQSLSTYQPKVAVFGKTGSGKSSLCNALFGKDVAAVSDCGGCTRQPGEYLLSLTSDKGIVLVDMPGVGETQDLDREYRELYTAVLSEVDLVLWLVDAKDRALAVDKEFFSGLFQKLPEMGRPIFVVMSQIDCVNPLREWSQTGPGPKQTDAIERKRKFLSEAFDVPLGNVIPVSAIERFGLKNLVESIVFALPNEKKFPFLNSVSEEIVTVVAKEEACKGLIEYLLDVAQRASELLEKARPYIPVLIKIVEFFSRRAVGA